LGSKVTPEVLFSPYSKKSFFLHKKQNHPSTSSKWTILQFMLQALWQQQMLKRLPQQKNLAQRYAEAFAALMELHLLPLRLLKQLRNHLSLAGGRSQLNGSLLEILRGLPQPCWKHVIIPMMEQALPLPLRLISVIGRRGYSAN
jgi:hypothetical protein